MPSEQHCLPSWMYPEAPCRPSPGVTAFPRDCSYGWRAARKAKLGAAPTEPMEFMPLGVFRSAEDEGPAMIAAPAPVTPDPTKPAPSRGSSMDERLGLIEIDLPNGARVRVDAFVNQRALHRVLAAMKDLL